MKGLQGASQVIITCLNDGEQFRPGETPTTREAAAAGHKRRQWLVLVGVVVVFLLILIFGH
jgi:hypothetical protein